jgi:hypothetical protein
MYWPAGFVQPQQLRVEISCESMQMHWQYQLIGPLGGGVCWVFHRPSRGLGSWECSFIFAKRAISSGVIFCGKTTSMVTS